MSLSRRTQILAAAVVLPAAIASATMFGDAPADAPLETPVRLDQRLTGSVTRDAPDPAVTRAFLIEALEALEADHEFLLKGDVFTKDQIEAYAELKWEEVMRTETTPCPVEFDMYYKV